MHIRACFFNGLRSKAGRVGVEMRSGWIGRTAVLVLLAAGVVAHAEDAVLMEALTSELGRAQSSLGHQNARQTPPYFLSYAVADARNLNLRAQFGALVSSNQSHERTADVEVRLGSRQLDNTHGQHRSSAVTSITLPLVDDREALARSLWRATNAGYANALDHFLRVQTESQVRAREEDSSADFSEETPQQSLGREAAAQNVDRKQWEQRLARLTAIFRKYPDVIQNVAVLSVSSETDYFVSSEGARIAEPHRSARLVVFATTRAEDGMDLFRDQTFEAETVDGLPNEAELTRALDALGQSLEQLRKAPITEPFDGPAILSGRAAAVFFHEVLGHRLEGQRQRGDNEGQTFTKELGKPVLPAFLSVTDDPTREREGQTWLSGQYHFDDEGQPAQAVPLVVEGVLRNFLMSRQPIASFSHSNGHGRAQSGHVPTGRQGNLIVRSTHAMAESELRQQLLAEARRQGKAYGLYFEDISSGFAVTERSAPQAFQVIPLVVWRVYVDGRPDELVRGVSIVGTPLAAMKRIAATGDRSEVFNGVCGAESGSVPVSAVAPAMLLSEIETQRQQQGTARPPILPIPGSAADSARPAPQKEAR